MGWPGLALSTPADSAARGLLEAWDALCWAPLLPGHVSSVAGLPGFLERPLPSWLSPRSVLPRTCAYATGMFPVVACTC